MVVAECLHCQDLPEVWIPVHAGRLNPLETLQLCYACSLLVAWVAKAFTNYIYVQKTLGENVNLR